MLVVCATADAERAQVSTPPCPLEIVGIWKRTLTPESTPSFLGFSADGWVNVLDGDADGRAQDFTVAAQVKYRLVADASSTRLEFSAGRGNDVFPPGVSSWDIAQHGDTSFTTMDRESGELTYWVRVQTHRYFLTLASRLGAAAEGPVLAMWTSLDGRHTRREAFGVHAASGGATVLFGPLPEALARTFATERDETHVMLRVELTEAEFRRSHAVLDVWAERVKAGRLPSEPPDRLVVDLIRQTIESVNHCGTRIDVPELPATAGGDTGRHLPERLIRLLRAANARRHVHDYDFPVGWQPPAVR
jgi:hypothetical protein